MTELQGIVPPVQPSSPLSANLPHRPADDSEEVYFEGSPLLRGAVGRNLLLEAIGVVLIVLPVLIHAYVHRPISIWVLLGLALVGLALACYPPVHALTIRYKVTNYRIDYERGLLSKDIDTLELWHVEDVHYHQTVRDRLLNIATITIISHDPTTPRLEMHSLPHSRHLFDILKQRIIAVKRQSGVLKMDTGT